MKNFLIAANWKMNLLKNKGEELARSICDFKNSEILLCPNFLLIDSISQVTKDGNIKIGAQDSYTENAGAFTGCISPASLKDVGCEYVILGHSERRTLFNESNNLVNKKAEASHKNNLKTIICIGETGDERKSGKTLKVIEEQLRESLPASSNNENTVIAYEPVWAIGTGLTPTIKEITEVHQFIANLLDSVNLSTHIIYGGSAKSSNAEEILKIKNVNGLLVGSSSLRADEFNKIIQIAENQPKTKNQKPKTE